MENIFGVHHRHMCVIYLKDRYSCTIIVNTHVYLLVRNSRDVSHLQCLQLVMEAFNDAYVYLILDCSPSGEETYRVSCSKKIFAEENTIVYQSRK